MYIITEFRHEIYAWSFPIFNIWLNKIYHLLKKKNLAQGQQNGRKARKNKSFTAAPYWASWSGLLPSLKEAGLSCPGTSALIPIPKHQNWI